MSRKSFAVGTGAMALSPLVDMLAGIKTFFFPYLVSLLGSDRTYVHVGRTARRPSRSELSAGASEVEVRRSVDERARGMFALQHRRKCFTGRPAGKRSWEFLVRWEPPKAVTVMRRYSCHG